MANNASTLDYYKKLKDSVTFNMSLSSKELFHSNFLAWLADVDPARFLIVLQSLGANTKDLNALCYYPLCLENISQENSLVKPKTQENELLPNYWIVRREYKNFDICVIDQLNPYDKYGNPVDLNEGDYIGGRIRVVIENKVKSIPYEVQLSSYTKKVKEYNSKWFRATCKDICKTINKENKGNDKKDNKVQIIGEASIEKSTFLLLSLAESFPQKDIITKPKPRWKVKSYADYSNALECFKDYYDNQIIGIVEDYLRFIIALHNLSQTWVKEDKFLYFEIEKNTRKYSDNYKKCKALRIHDLYHKLRFSNICSKLITELEKIGVTVTTSRIDEYIDPNKQQPNNLQKSPIVYAGIEFLHGEPLIELHVYIPNNSFLYVIQSQGGVYQHGIISKCKSSDVWNKLGNTAGYIIKNNWMNINQTNIKNVITVIDPEQYPLLPKGKNINNSNPGYYKYDMKDGSYVYQARQIPNGTKISAIIDMMVEDCQSLLSQNP